jgi:SAM-dependent methyltransferase
MHEKRQRKQTEYLSDPGQLWRWILRRFLSLGGDYRHPASRAAFNIAIASQPENANCVSIGGGPTRVHPRLINLNIKNFQNVDIVGNAYHLPFLENSIDAIHCEAVLEHLEYPNLAVREMFRTLHHNGQVFAVTPFLQAFHGYPSHYQNFTLEGHRRLFVRAGFEVVNSGTCVGPIYGITDQLAYFFTALFPGLIGRIFSLPWRIAALVFRPLDMLFWRHHESHRLASTTFVHAKKPASGR